VTLRVALFATATLLAGCGQKGPLYLPDEPGEVVTRPAQDGATPQAPAEPEKKKQDESGTPRS
jgi:predicted small lipoprotein YifL